MLIKKITVLLVMALLMLSACDKKTETADKGVMQADKVMLEVYKDPACGCCGEWIKHAEKYDFSGKAHHVENMNLVKDKYGITPELQSCHTSVTSSGYVFEGHVPAKLIQRFLANPPSNAVGLSVPGMPRESPGMEMGGKFTPYDVVLINKDGSTKVFEHISQKEDQY